MNLINLIDQQTGVMVWIIKWFRFGYNFEQSLNPWYEMNGCVSRCMAQMKVNGQWQLFFLAWSAICIFRKSEHIYLVPQHSITSMLRQDQLFTYSILWTIAAPPKKLFCRRFAGFGRCWRRSAQPEDTWRFQPVIAETASTVNDITRKLMLL